MPLQLSMSIFRVERFGKSRMSNRFKSFKNHCLKMPLYWGRYSKNTTPSKGFENVKTGKQVLRQLGPAAAARRRKSMFCYERSSRDFNSRDLKISSKIFPKSAKRLHKISKKIILKRYAKTIPDQQKGP